MSAVRISSRDNVEQKSPGDMEFSEGGLADAGGELTRAAGEGWAMRMRLERVRCGYSHSVPRAEHRRHEGSAKSQRRLALVQAEHDLPLDGGIARRGGGQGSRANAPGGSLIVLGGCREGRIAGLDRIADARDWREGDASGPSRGDASGGIPPDLVGPGRALFRGAIWRLGGRDSERNPAGAPLNPRRWLFAVHNAWVGYRSARP